MNHTALRLAGALALGAAGGGLAAWARVPLAWMIGAMLLTTTAAVSGYRYSMPRPLRGGMIAVLGVMLGSAFTPALLDRIGLWGVSLAGLALFMGLATWVLYLFYRHIAGYDSATAYFCAAPGGLQEMVLAGIAQGGDGRVLALIHAARILFVVMSLPLGFVWVFGDYGGGAGTRLTGWPPVADLLWLGGCCVVGTVLGRMIRLPAYALVGPMIASAAVHLAGLSQATPPAVVVAIAQVVIGTGLGARFTGLRLADLLRIVGMGLLATPILLGVTVALAWGVHLITGQGLPGLILAYAPGGLAETSLIALYLQIDTAFVAAHHIIRVVVIVSLWPLIFRLLRLG